jgi:hypothetical protein
MGGAASKAGWCSLSRNPRLSGHPATLERRSEVGRGRLGFDVLVEPPQRSEDSVDDFDPGPRLVRFTKPPARLELGENPSDRLLRRRRDEGLRASLRSPSCCHGVRALRSNERRLPLERSGGKWRRDEVFATEERPPCKLLEHRVRLIPLRACVSIRPTAPPSGASWLLTPGAGPWLARAARVAAAGRRAPSCALPSMRPGRAWARRAR